jgi:hypothetical protein
LGAGGEVDLATPVRTGGRKPFDNLFDPVNFQAQVAQYPPGNTAFFENQPQKQVFGSDGVMAHALRFLVSQAEDAARPLGKTFHSSQGKILLYYGKPTATLGTVTSIGSK